EVVAVADANPANFTTTAPVGNLASGSEEGLSLEGVAQYTDAGALLADPKVDVALIGLPTHLHAQFIKEALAAGKHVICEKPLVCDSATGEDLLKAIDASDRFVFVGHCIRFWPTYSVAYDRVKSGQYGRV